MAEAMSSDTISESIDDNLSDISAERPLRHVVVGQQAQFYNQNNQRHLLQKLFTREIRGCLSQHHYAVEERLFNTIPSWGYLPLLQVIPMSALQAGHIVMGLTQCGQFVLTYTCNVDLRGTGSLYKYLLHWWAFSPKRVARKVAEVTLFGNYTVSHGLDVVVAQWPMDRNKIVIHGLHSDWGQSQTNDRAYLTITTVPSLANCKDCAKVAASYEEEELAANWDGCVRCNCLVHGLTVHTTYEMISPYPRFRAPVCLNYWNHVVLNTGNFLHVLTVNLNIPKCKIPNSNEKSDSVISDMVQLDVSDVYELDDVRTECYDIPNEKNDISESVFELSPTSRDSTIDRDFVVDENIKKPNDELLRESISFNLSDNNLNNSLNNSNAKVCECNNPMECECIDKTNIINIPDDSAISVRDKILQDFCEDVSQELNIGSDSITLVKHPSCSPRSTPQRLPTDSRQPWSNLTPPSDILKTRNNESSHEYAKNRRATSPQPGTSHDTTNTTCITSINSPLHTLSISPSPCSPRLMSPPMITSFRHPSPRKRATTLHSPPPRTRATHKLILEAEKAYEFTDDAQETCEKLSSFRKRRLADKKYEFREEAEDTENIIPFKHIRDQSEQRLCSVHRISSREVSPAYSNGKWHRIDSENSESEDNFINQDVMHSCFQPVEPAKKSILRPLSQNQLYNYITWHYKILSQYGHMMVKPDNISPLAPKTFIPHPIIKCTAHYKRSYIELDDEMVSVITDVEDDETGGYVSYQCVLPMNVHGSGYVQMQMISNSKAEKMMLPYVSINQFSFDIETFSHHIADWICKRFKKKYWHCSDYDIEIINVCAISGDVICVLIMKIQASEYCTQSNCSQERKTFEAGCKFMWNIDSNQYKITHILPMLEKPGKPNMNELVNGLWNPTRYFIPNLRKKCQQHYARPVRYLQHSMVSSDSLTQICDMDNLVSFYMTPLPEEIGPD
ncbi:hypothetical protein PV327_004257 [Microctonus hyperodae]|uniref:DDB1- and CUL4-associated factor 15 WD40 repeat-containing domain-containing protein n=1 Tax=Microctonus hyperodae TaxID=165561 RepID=A0AA39FC18_MICHY|nr:hypothetical protein PV327_004257 [Microctonus hyperodae]